MYRILVIDCNNDLLQLLEHCLKLYAFHPLTANNFSDGYKLACQELPDLILTADEFSRFDGLELWQALQNYSETKKIPFLLMTDADSKHIPKLQLYLTENEIIFKPFDTYTLIKAIYSKLQLSKPRWDGV
ncbi:response regulator [Nostoc sp. FACHB-152]|uniref:response regulator n=1 Tax=unclassified Nostoc TaxID=2593658 RepID=UPI001689F537|nr:MULTISPECIES: response regulator [unclassified Nostoc]MBD2445616.1 response regulator [Nostoc sp. FACHB-152]MBD2466729.1 response regulator [Nostoc sp. FACHB-145]